MKRIGLIFATVVFPATAAERNVDEFFSRFTDEWMRFHTDFAASARYFTGPEQERVERQIEPNYSPAWVSAEQKLIAKGLRDLRGYNRAAMTEQQRLSADLILWDLEEQQQRARHADLSFPFFGFRGAQVDLPQVLTIGHQIASMRDAENYVARLGLIGARMDEATAEARRLARKKLLPPKFIIDQTLGQLNGFVGMEAAKNPFVESFEARMKRVDAIPATKREELRAAAEKLTAGQVYPAWKRAIAALESMAPQAGQDAGIWRFPNGAAAYQQALRRYTTTPMTPDQIHAKGLEMVAALEKKIDAVLTRAGHTQGTLVERRAAFWRAQPRYENGEVGVRARQADIDATIADAQRRATSLFDRVPKAPVIAQPYPEFMGQRSATYQDPAPDGSRPGTFQYTADKEGGPKGRKSTIYHETIPGHHYQLALMIEDKTLPRFRQLGVFGFNSAYVEGWGLYGEKLAAENGWYQGDAAGELDQLEQEVFRARRLVVDTGLHAKRWTRQQAIDYGIAPNEIDRYVVMPGQACSYMIGQLKLIELRERARGALGAEFSVKDYHNLVLGLGMVPLEILEREVDRWIAARRG